MAGGSIHTPDSFWKLQQLRNACGAIQVDGCPQMDHLKNLQMLTVVRAGRWIKHGLSQLTNLRKLGLYGRLSLHKEALSCSMVKLEHLRSLKLIGEDEIPTTAFFGHLRKLYMWGCLKELSHVHEFPPNLTKLTLLHSRLEPDPMVTLEQLPNLQTLKLLDSSYTGDKMVCTGRGFHRLKKLELCDLNGLEERTVMESAIPSLESLDIHDCDGFKMFPKGLVHVTTLELLVLQKKTLKYTVKLEDN
ncbi:hypothetical protein HHK36_030100 [Tetracentron sinense]|uniref:Disease resistance R13L4/SHOC-2-like LRR domain-containing protein n=1 Tax=Tetracentron sinense TaxID=13715 RepID=A0A834YEZ0_TETSI|nr:hypothetical protein HHK36_030100 [Tetracentron sinense]